MLGDLTTTAGQVKVKTVKLPNCQIENFLPGNINYHQNKKDILLKRRKYLHIIYPKTNTQDLQRTHTTQQENNPGESQRWSKGT